MDITERQREVLAGLLEYEREQGYAPSVRELQEFMGWKSSYAAQHYLRLFRSRGWVTEANGFRRAYKSTAKGRRAAR